LSVITPADTAAGENSIVTCRSCGSDKQHIFEAEIPVVFAKFEDRGKPIIRVFPRLLICLSCGYVEFVVPVTELRVIRDNARPNEPGLSTQVRAPAD
jgi:hypothetical protein